MKKILLITFIFNSLMVQAQEIMVVDSINMAPIPFVNISFPDNRGAITNDDGNFILNKDEIYIQLSHLNYKIKKIHSTDIKDTIYLNPLVNELDEVVLETFSSKDSIEKAISYIKSNYVNEPINQEGIFRYSLKENDKGVEMIESIFTSYSPSLSKAYTCRINKIKRTKPFEHVDFYGGLIDVLNKVDIVRRQGGIFEDLEDFDFRFSGTIVREEESFYKINFSGEQDNFTRNGYLYLNSKDLAILEIYQESKAKNEIDLNENQPVRINSTGFLIKYIPLDNGNYVLSFARVINDIDGYFEDKSIYNYVLENKLAVTHSKIGQNISKIKNNYDEKDAFNKITGKFDKKQEWTNIDILPMTNDELQILNDIYQ
jgi:uncharacterized protein YjhX (UPF0386 family)